MLRAGRRTLGAFFAPRAVALIGATDKPGSVGRTILTNLIGSPFGGTVYPVNPKRRSVVGIPAVPSVSAIAEPVDLAIVVTPPPGIPAIIEECGQAGIGAVIVISAGFKEVGPEGAELERQAVAAARKHGMRLIGPNCLGVMSPVTGLNATFAAAIAPRGRVAFVSQSGALVTAVLDWALREKVGFSSIVSLGSMADVGWGDLIDHLGNDRETDAIVMYMETVGDARSFLSAAREVALTKPIIVMKPGRTAEAAKAAASHTGSLAGSDDVLDAAFRRAGVLRAERISDLFYLAEVLGKQPRPRGPNLTVVTNAGGPGVLATDALIMGGGKLTQLSPETMSALDKVLPPTWSHNNPVDIIGDAPPDRYASALEIAARDPHSDGMLVVLTPQAMTDPTRTAQQLVPFAKGLGKPVMASWMGGLDVEAGATILREAGIATFPFPDSAARMFTELWGWQQDLTSLYETPALPEDEESLVHREQAHEIIAAARAAGRTILAESESKAILAAYGIPITETRIAPTEDEAVAAAEAIGFPVVLKLYSHTITHKTDVGGVKLNLRDVDQVREAFGAIRTAVAEKKGLAHFEGVTVQPMIDWAGYELIVGSSIDSQFGPVLLFGLGGQLVEVFKDRALGLPPLTTTLARRMLEHTRIFEALKGVRGRDAVDIAALEGLLVRFSELVVEHPEIAEIDINPLLASADRLLALDARVILHPADLPASALPRPAIRPYPLQYRGKYVDRNGEELCIRPIRPEDETLLVEFHRTLSERSIYQRYFENLGLDRRIAHERLIRVCFTDYDRELALVAERKDPVTGAVEIAGVGRLSKLRDGLTAEFAILVSDRYQGRGLGSELLTRLIDVGRREGLHRIVAEILDTNGGMIRLSKRLGFEVTGDPMEGSMTAVLDLTKG
ncbi:MAG: bifunctional acetate--CoA ligase family protein/GNAT family N-acetyltransferase [Chloroflexota bacterium]